MHDYILLFDESGQPYLEHAWLRKGETPKYKLKVDNYYGEGKHLYLYTDREVAAFKNRGKVTLSAKLKDRLGWDERSARDDAAAANKNASDALSKRATGENVLRAEKAKKELARTQTAYENTFAGKAEKRHRARQTKLSEIRSGKETSSENQNGSNESPVTSSSSEDKIWTPSFKANKATSSKAQTTAAVDEEDKEEKEEEKKSSTSSGSSRGSAASASNNQNNKNTATSGVQVSTVQHAKYDPDDPDFSEDSFNKSEKIGDTNFLTFQRSDGLWVILDSGMKWVLPEGVSGKDQEIEDELEAVANMIESARASSKEEYSDDRYAEAVSKAINDAVKVILIKKSNGGNA